ncbi:putative ABC transport system permease protein [Aliiruegeria haliotis]|uniref:Putative ABC transport system permease protein n=1 Tax=Aliiruegeria haliotis TaxID=1280846 RepID=A0A2T0RUT6_9RHOB|nr:ABC transporter permease [Aliiruegeria haliotis]PRY24924.1 putative ABC transport system permease protein [Aliiruegeria haliotis]
MRRAALQALLSHWRRQPLQLLTLLAGLALATALWSAVQAINAEARRSYAQAASVLDRGTLANLTAPGGTIATDTYAALRRAGWKVSPVIEGRIVRGGQRVAIVGLEPLTAPQGALPETVGPAVPPQEMFSHPGVGFAAPQTVAALADLPDSHDLPRLVAAASMPPGQILTDIAVAGRLLDLKGSMHRLIVLPEQPATRRPLEDVAPDLTLTPPRDGGDLARLTDSFHLNLTAFGLLSFAVGLFIVHGAVGLAFEQRRQVFRTLRALGLPLGTLLGMLLAELLILALIAGSFGVTAGYLIAGALLPDVAATLRGLYGASVPGSLTFDPGWAVSGLGIALLGTLVAAANGLLAVRRMPLLASAQPRAWATLSGRAVRRQAVAGAVLATLGALAPLLADGLVAGFVLMGGLLLGAALALPFFLTTVLGICAGRARSATWEWFWADTRQQLPGLSLALMALLLALATNIGVTTMVSSFRLTFTGWLDQRLVSQLYVTARNEADGEALRAWLTPRAEAVLPIWSLELPLNGTVGEVYGIIDHPIYAEKWPLLAKVPDAWDRLASGTGVLVNEQLARREEVSLGDPLSIGEDWTLPVVAIYSDYGNPLGQAITGLDPLQAGHPELPRLRHGVLTDDPDGLLTALREDFGLPDANMTHQANLKAFSMQVFERTFAVTAALNVLTLAVAAFAILTSLLTLSAMRLPQLAPVWALGLTRSHLARMEVVRSLALAALTFVLALPTGLLLAWALLAVVNVEAFGWRLPMFLFPAQWLALFALALLAALIAAALPVRRLARTAPAQFLKVFADER